MLKFNKLIKYNVNYIYIYSIIFCLCSSVLFEYRLRKIRPIKNVLDIDFLQEIGYIFTGLSILSLLLLYKRCSNLRSKIAIKEYNKRLSLINKEIIFSVLICELSSLYGLIYYKLGGFLVERFARGFIIITPIMFILFVSYFKKYSNINIGKQ